MKSVVKVRNTALEERESSSENDSEYEEDRRERDWRKRSTNLDKSYNRDMQNYSEDEIEDRRRSTNRSSNRKDDFDENNRHSYSEDEIEDRRSTNRSNNRKDDFDKRDKRSYRSSEDDVEDRRTTKKHSSSRRGDFDERSKKRSRNNENKERSRLSSEDEDKSEKKKKRVNAIPTEEEKKKKIEEIFTKSGGAYIPPSKLRQLQEGITDKNSIAYQRMSWEALKKSINGLVNKVNVSNIGFIVEELLHENIVRGRGLVCQSIMRAQVASPTFTNVYAALVSIINTKFPKIGELLLRRLIIQFRRSFKRNDKPVCINSVKFIGHLVNQQVAHELISLEILTLLLQNPSGDAVEVAVSFLKEVGQKLTEISPRGINAVFESLRRILHDSNTEKRVQYMIEVMFAIRKDGFKDYTSVLSDLDLVEEDDQITHILRIDDKGTSEDLLNVFKHDPNYEENEQKYNQIKSEILGSEESGSSDDEDSDEEDEDGNENEENENEEKGSMEIIDRTETNLVALRRLIYLTIQSSLDYEECAHKMMKLNIRPGQEHEFCAMVLECCAQQRSYEKFFGLLGQRFCLLKKEFMAEYVNIFKEQYDGCHQLETNKLRNTAKFFGHLLHSDALAWTVMECIKLNEDDTTSSSRIFIKVLFQDLAEYLGVQKLQKRLAEPIVAPYLEGLFPRDNPRDTRFAINFFTAVGLGGLTEELRAHLKTVSKAQQQQHVQAQSNSSSSSSSSSESSSDESSSSSSSSEESDLRKSKQQKKRRRDSPRSDRKNDRRSERKSETRKRR